MSGHEATLKALAAATRPGGVVMVGEPDWHKDPSPEYLEAAGMERRTFVSYWENVETGLAQGLGFLHAVASTLDEWDRYEGYKTLASERGQAAGLVTSESREADPLLLIPRRSAIG
ncbi:MAG: hypothetical protein AAEJ53_04535 [Myxococcota bacterium]